jgi:hypothetical protein
VKELNMKYEKMLQKAQKIIDLNHTRKPVARYVISDIVKKIENITGQYEEQREFMYQNKFIHEFAIMQEMRSFLN